MNTAKRERIIKNLYDLQCLDSWEDGSDFIECIKSVLSNNGFSFYPLYVLTENRKLDVIRVYQELGYNARNEDFDEDQWISFYNSYNYSEDAFSDETNYNLSFEQFNNLCYKYIDFGL
jgi:hypothetical protein